MQIGYLEEIKKDSISFYLSTSSLRLGYAFLVLKQYNVCVMQPYAESRFKRWNSCLLKFLSLAIVEGLMSRQMHMNTY